jgi:RNA polymerase sigma factor (TIGR02999 family)
LPIVYDQLRRLAARQIALEKPGQTLDPTALVHEAYLRLAAGPTASAAAQIPRWRNREHLLAAAKNAMRRVLIEKARAKKGPQRGGDRQRVDLFDVPAAHQEPERLLALDEAIVRLGSEDPAAAAVAELRFYTGRTVDEAAEALDMSRAQAYRHWHYARAFLRVELGHGRVSQVQG